MPQQPQLDPQTEKEFDEQFGDYIDYLVDHDLNAEEKIKAFIAQSNERARSQGAQEERQRLLDALKGVVWIDQRTLKGTHVDWQEVKRIFTTQKDPHNEQ